jgi:hypothetical protein
MNLLATFLSLAKQLNAPKCEEGFLELYFLF